MSNGTSYSQVSATDQRRAPTDATPFARDKEAVLLFCGVIALALIVRMIFYPGGMGTVGGGVRLLYGEPVESNYIGGLRYGQDIPVAFFLWLFGPSEASANVWGMLTSLLEVGFVFLCGFLLWGRRAAVYSGLVASFLPLHVNIAGRMAADSPLAAFITLSFVCFLVGERKNSAFYFLGAGLAAGAVFWVKHSVILYATAFVLYALATRTWNWKWCWGAVGALGMFLANCLLMWHWQGDPLHVFRITGEGLGTYGVRTDIDDSVWLYFRYLFVDVRHTWLLAYLALAGVVIGLVRSSRLEPENPIIFPTIWALSLLTIFSFTVISMDPLRFIMKQSNYMVIFLAPLCVLSGYALSEVGRKWAPPVAGVYVLGGIVLAALVQQDLRVFGANSRPAVAYAQAHPEKEVFVTAYTHRIADFDDSISPSRVGKPIVSALNDLTVGTGVSMDSSVAKAGRSRVAIIDTQNLHWGVNPISGVQQIPACWRKLGELKDVEVSGAGRYVVNAMLTMSAILPNSVDSVVRPRLLALAVPKPAYIYEIPDGCGL